MMFSNKSDQSLEKNKMALKMAVISDIDGVQFFDRQQWARYAPKDLVGRYRQLAPHELYRDAAQGAHFQACRETVNLLAQQAGLGVFHGFLSSKVSVDDLVGQLLFDGHEFFSAWDVTRLQSVPFVSAPLTASEPPRYLLDVNDQLLQVTIPVGFEDIPVDTTGPRLISPVMIVKTPFADDVFSCSADAIYPCLALDAVLREEVEAYVTGKLKAQKLAWLCHHAKIECEHVVMIDDRPQVIEELQTAGFQAIHFPVTKTYDVMQGEIFSACQDIIARLHDQASAPVSDLPSPPFVVKTPWELLGEVVAERVSPAAVGQKPLFATAMSTVGGCGFLAPPRPVDATEVTTTESDCSHSECSS
jgi:hypothetical protein